MRHNNLKRRPAEPSRPSVDADGFSTSDGQVDQWGRAVLSQAKLKMLQAKMQAAMLGTDPQKFLER
jgi:hypothetical protein